MILPPFCNSLLAKIQWDTFFAISSTGRSTLMVGALLFLSPLAFHPLPESLRQVVISKSNDASFRKDTEIALSVGYLLGNVCHDANWGDEKFCPHFDPTENKDLSVGYYSTSPELGGGKICGIELK